MLAIYLESFHLTWAVLSELTPSEIIVHFQRKQKISKIVGYFFKKTKQIWTSKERCSLPWCFVFVVQYSSLHLRENNYILSEMCLRSNTMYFFLLMLFF